MKKEVMSTLAQLEDFDEQLYKVSGKTNDPKGSSENLIATSEQPVCGYYKLRKNISQSAMVVFPLRVQVGKRFVEFPCSLI